MAGLSTIALLAVSAANTINQYVGGRRAASATQQQADYEAQLMGLNANLEDAQARDAILRGDEQAGRVRQSARTLAGAQRAAFASQGVEVDSGSPRDVVASDLQLSEVDAMTIRNNARRVAWGFQAQAGFDRAEADYTRAAGRNQAKALRRQATGTLLSGAAELANIYSSAPKGGVSRRSATSDYGTSTYGSRGMFG